LRRRFFLYLLFVHLVFFGVTAWRLDGWWLLAVELFFAVSLLAGWRLLQALLEPVRFLETSSDLLEVTDYTTRFREIGQVDVDRLIRLYNRMIDTLREERLQNREQEQLLLRITSISPAGIVVLDHDERIVSANPAAVSMFDRAEEALRGLRLDELEVSFARRLASLAEGGAQILNLRGRRRVRAQRLSFMDRGFRRGFLVLDELTTELHQSEKAAYDKLIRMMSHEVNNTSGAVISLLESCLTYAPSLDEADRPDFVEALNVATRRTSHMNDFMRSFADVIRLPRPSKAPCDLVGVVREVEALMRTQLAEHNIRWSFDAPDGFPLVTCDRNQMEQALVNIVKNAVEAIDHDGAIEVSATHQKGHARLVIEDTGGGIPSEVQDHLFTSFFTTKPSGQGIGLTLIQEILLGHGFDYALETSSPGRAAFRIEIPVGSHASS
jgi:signal transduction histidine kinase